MIISLWPIQWVKNWVSCTDIVSCCCFNSIVLIRPTWTWRYAWLLRYNTLNFMRPDLHKGTCIHLCWTVNSQFLSPKTIIPIKQQWYVKGIVDRILSWYTVLSLLTSQDNGCQLYTCKLKDYLYKSINIAMHTILTEHKCSANHHMQRGEQS